MHEWMNIPFKKQQPQASLNGFSDWNVSAFVWRKFDEGFLKVEK